MCGCGWMYVCVYIHLFLYFVPIWVTTEHCVEFPVLLWRTVWSFLKKLEIELPYDPAIPLLGIHTEETRIERDTCTPVFIAALFIVARTWKQQHFGRECKTRQRRMDWGREKRKHFLSLLGEHMFPKALRKQSFVHICIY